MPAAPTATAAPGRLQQLVERIEALPDFAEVVDSLQAGHAATLDGVWGSSCALVAAALARAASAVLVIVCPRLDEVQGLIGDLSIFSAEEPARFPVHESLSAERMVQDEAVGDRIRILKSLLGPRPPKVLVTSMPALLQPVPSREKLAQQTRTLRTGEPLSLDKIASWLATNGYQNTTAVELPGEFARRGGIIDIFAPDWFQPVRIELFGDEIESIRPFEVESQRSHQRLETIDVTAVVGAVPREAASTPSPPAPLPEGEGRLAHLADYLPPQSWFLLVEPGDLESEGRQYLERLARPQGFHTVADVIRQRDPVPLGHRIGHRHRFAGNDLPAADRIGRAVQRRHQQGPRRIGRRGSRAGGVSDLPDRGRSPPAERSISAATQAARDGRLHFPVGTLQNGFRLVPDRIVLLEQRRTVSPHRRPASGRCAGDIWAARSTASSNCTKAISSSTRPRHRPLSRHEAAGKERTGRGAPGTGVPRQDEALRARRRRSGWCRSTSAERRAGRRWPNSAAGSGTSRRSASKRPSPTWPPTCSNCRPCGPRGRASAFRVDTEWQHEFDASFPYHGNARPVDCASRRSSTTCSRRGRWTACSAATWATARPKWPCGRRSRRSMPATRWRCSCPRRCCASSTCGRSPRGWPSFPSRSPPSRDSPRGGSRTRSSSGWPDGAVDIVIGTHRLVQPDVAFHNLGLVIIDEEQRFGVEVKERLKALRQTVDVLTMTATPIPRTLHMGLLGAARHLQPGDAARRPAGGRNPRGPLRATS